MNIFELEKLPRSWRGLDGGVEHFGDDGTDNGDDEDDWLTYGGGDDKGWEYDDDDCEDVEEAEDLNEDGADDGDLNEWVDYITLDANDTSAADLQSTKRYVRAILAMALIYISAQQVQRLLHAICMDGKMGLTVNADVNHPRVIKFCNWEDDQKSQQ